MELVRLFGLAVKRAGEAETRSTKDDQIISKRRNKSVLKSIECVSSPTELFGLTVGRAREAETRSKG